jgi:DNA polymerase-3 subunit epsilon
MSDDRTRADSGDFGATFDALGTPLHLETFVIVDLETSGSTPEEAGITEIGAVKVRGGEVLGEFQTLVNPGEPIPPFISLLTGINDAMLVDAPTLETVIPLFFEWAGDAVFVAHNAPFDIGFLRHASRKVGRAWPSPRVLDTVTLAKAALLRDEVPNRKLATLAKHFGSPTEPVHRALADARATNHVMHALFERLGSIGVTTIEELLNLGTVIKPAQRKKRTLAEHLPDSPGIYVFQDDKGKPLYVGKSRNIRKRALSYFTRSETRDRMSRMIDLTSSVQGIECHTDLEAQVRELRLIGETKPPFNAAGKRQERTIWIRLTQEPYPRLSAVRAIRPDLGIAHFGPVTSMETANLVIDAITSVIPLRTCTAKLSVKKATSSCALADMGRCSAPCELRISVDEYRHHVEALLAAVSGASTIEDALNRKIADYSGQERFEEAAIHRDRLHAWLTTMVRHHRLQSFTRIEELIAAHQNFDGEWEVHVIRYGALAAAARTKETLHVPELANAARLTAQAFETPHAPAPANSISEAHMVLKWCEQWGVRILDATDTWHNPWPSQLRHRDVVDQLAQARNNAALVAPVKKFARFTAPR